MAIRCKILWLVLLLAIRIPLCVNQKTHRNLQLLPDTQKKSDFLQNEFEIYNCFAGIIENNWVIEKNNLKKTMDFSLLFWCLCSWWIDSGWRHYFPMASQGRGDRPRHCAEAEVTDLAAVNIPDCRTWSEDLVVLLHRWLGILQMQKTKFKHGCRVGVRSFNT